MRRFTQMQLREAIAYAADGGQALHTHRIIPSRDRAPRCFVRAVDAGQDIAHLFDQDRDRLERTARRLGVRVIVVERAGTLSQHIDLCGGPLRQALVSCDNNAKEMRRDAL
jgi:uncharacterized protein (DUF58 family)